MCIHSYVVVAKYLNQPIGPPVGEWCIQCSIQSFDGTLQSHEKEYTQSKQISMDKSQKHNCEWTDWLLKCHTLLQSVCRVLKYYACLKKQTQISYTFSMWICARQRYSQGLWRTSLAAQMVKHLSTARRHRFHPWVREDPLEMEIAVHSSTIAWKVPWTRGALVGYSPWSRKKLDTTEATSHSRSWR